MGTSDEQELLGAARAGDRAAFDRLVGPYRRRIEAHGYRMLGSLADAEDVAQETLVRAWRGIAGYEGRASVKNWLYRIATNVALDLCAQRQRRGLPNDRGEPQPAGAPLAPPDPDPVWLEPAPADLWEQVAGDPEAALSARESVGLAFLVAIQKLPAAQRAVLLLREVLGFSAQEAADLLETSPAAVNSSLQRARAALDEGDARDPVPRDDDARALLARYVAAWTEGTTEAFAALLREDAILTMPPIPSWFRGPAAIAAFVRSLRPMGEARFLPAIAAGGPAVAAYVRAPGEGAFRATALHVLCLDDAGRVRAVHAFLIPERFARFGLPDAIEEK